MTTQNRRPLRLMAGGTEAVCPACGQRFGREQLKTRRTAEQAGLRGDPWATCWHPCATPQPPGGSP